MFEKRDQNLVLHGLSNDTSGRNPGSECQIDTLLN